MASGAESNAERRLGELGVELPQAPAPAGAYVPATRTGSLIFTAGQLPFEGGELNLLGKVGVFTRVLQQHVTQFSRKDPLGGSQGA